MAAPRDPAFEEPSVAAGGVPIAGGRRSGLNWAWGAGLVFLLALVAVSGWGWRWGWTVGPGHPVDTAQPAPIPPPAATRKAP